MAGILLIHHHRPSRDILQALAERQHKALCAKDLTDGAKQIIRNKPDVVFVSQDSKKQEAIRLLRYMKKHEIKTPVIVVAPRTGGAFETLVMKFGAKAFIKQPIDQARFDQALDKALRARSTASLTTPPICEEELNSNISMLERELNKKMQCFAGRNQVYLQSIVLRGRPTKPRVCLRCNLRNEFGLPRDVYYEFIRDVCCEDSSACEAVEKFSSAHEIV